MSEPPSLQWEYRPDCLSDERHAELDREVCRSLYILTGDHTGMPRVPEDRAILCAVIKYSDGLLNHVYEDFKGSIFLLTLQPQLSLKLKAAWESKSFHEIRNLAILRHPRSSWSTVDDLLADHPRQDETSLHHVRQMLPFWYTGRHTAWFSDEVSVPEFRVTGSEMTQSSATAVVDAGSS